MAALQASAKVIADGVQMVDEATLRRLFAATVNVLAEIETLFDWKFYHRVQLDPITTIVLQKSTRA